MSIRLRLVISYLAMLIIPLVLSVIAAIVIYKVEEWRGNPIESMFEEEANIYVDIKQKSIRDPESLLQRSVLEQFDNRLNEIEMLLIIRIDKDIFYSSPDLEIADYIGKLPEFGTVEKDNSSKESNWLMRGEDFLLPDKREGSFFIIRDWSPMPRFVIGYIILGIITFVGILAFTNGVLTYWVSRSIIRPLKSLQRATEEIKEGNLDYQVKTKKKDEIGKLSIAFEEMRVKLKESVEVQLQYEENRKELISNISHDLKTPVTAIKGYVEGIMDGVTNSPDKLDRYVKTIYSKAVDMDRMIDELFLISKLDLGKLPFHFEKVDIGFYVQDCAQELTFDMDKRGIKLTLAALPKDSVLIKADREKLKRVLVNILENAMKYMDKEDGEIVLTLHTQKGNAVISVKDNGQGISEEALPHIFDRFYRADPSRNSATGGSGLGLAIAKQIIEEHDGHIWAESKLGQGTKVTISLPAWSKSG